MTLNDEQKRLMRETIGTVAKLNNLLAELRRNHIACNIRQSHDQSKSGWMLDATAIIRSEDYK